MYHSKRFWIGAAAVCLLLGGTDAWGQEKCAEEVQKLLPSDGAAGDNVAGVAVRGDVAVMGAWKHDDNGADSGAAWVFRFDGAQWIEEQELLASDGAPGDWFGPVATDGQIVVIGAIFDNDNGVDSGSVYVFRYNGAEWIEEQKLLASDGAAGDHFGVYALFEGEVMVIAADGDDDNGSGSGSAYIFRYNGAEWIEEQKLLASDGAAGDLFREIAISGDVVVIGARLDDDNGSASGSAYVFRYNGVEWVEEQKLLASDGASGDYFGWSVGVTGDVAVIGAPLESNEHGSRAGSVYVFRYNGAEWIEEQKLVASDGVGNEDFGRAIAFDGDVLLIGSVFDDDNGFDSGSAFIFLYDGSQWIEKDKLIASDGEPSEWFGGPLALNGNTALIAAYHDDDNGIDSGSVYFFDISDCLKGDGDDECAFADDVLYGVGNAPRRVALGDLDGDLDEDLVVANATSGDISVLFNNGNGAFAPDVLYDAGNSPWGVVMSDLDGDLDLDLAVTNLSSDTVSVFLNEGDGSFARHVQYGVGDEPTGIDAGDVDGDLDPDLVVRIGRQGGQGSLWVLLNNGDGTFAPGASYSTGDGQGEPVLADLDGDLDLDVASTSTDSDDLSVFLNNGDGTFAPETRYQVGDIPTGIGVGDLDGDLDLDLITANRGSINVSVLLNEGDGTFAAHVLYRVGDGPHSIAVGDMDGDLNLDLAADNRDSDDVSVLLGNGDGTFDSEVRYGVADGPHGIAASDLDGDSDLDLVTSNNNVDSVSVLLNICEGGEDLLAPLLSFNVAGGELIAGDLQSLEESDDDYVQIDAQLSNLGTAYVSRTLIRAKSPATTVSRLDLTLETGVDAELVTTRVFLRNFDTGDWDLLGGFTQSESDSQALILDVPNPNAYVRDDHGQIGVQIETRANAAQVPGGYIFRIDHVQLAVTTGEGGGIAGGGDALPCDLDGDNLVGTTDLLLLLGAWGECGNCNTCQPDFNTDCVVDATDLLILLGNWG